METRPSHEEAFERKLTRMTSAPVEGLVCRMAGPTIIIMLISAFYNMADTFFVGRLGTSATAAVGVSFSLMALVQALGFFFGQGSGNYISRQLGAGNYAEAGRMASMGFFLSLAGGAAVGAVGIFFIDPLAIALGSTPTILPHAREYLFYILLATPWMTAGLTLNNLLRFQGSAVYGMVGVTSGAVLNIVLDPILIFGCKLGVAGAAIATMISQLLSFCLLLAGCARGGNLAIRLSRFTPRLGDFGEIVRGGFPSLSRQGLASLAAIYLNRTAGAYGDAAIAAMSIVQRVAMFAGAALIGWGQGFQPVCGFNYGAGCYDRVRRAFWFCVKFSTGFLVLLAIAGFAYAPEIVALFRDDDPMVIRIGALALRCQSLTLPMLGWIILNNMMLQNIGRPGRASILAMSRQGLFLLPLLVLLPPRLGILGIQIAQPLADVGTFFLSFPVGAGVLRSLGDGAAEGEPPHPLEGGEMQDG